MTAKRKGEVRGKLWALSPQRPGSAVKFPGVIIPDEAEALASTAGPQTLIFDDQFPGSFFYEFETSYTLSLDRLNSQTKSRLFSALMATIVCIPA
ncbi:hypothetical protein [Bradyrhizobium sp. I1.7.5]|uniref:hypothetical protein n=1 Tax=Bradyrhizobium sp. I1.7.5 TaxID=3156363 RepID=UPI0033949A84